MTLILRLALALIAVVGASQASASAQEMLSNCRSIASAKVVADGNFILKERTLEAGKCLGFFRAIQQVTVFVDDKKRRLFYVCTPPDGNLLQIISVFVAYAEKHPARLHEDEFDVAIKSLQEAFPCR